MRMAAVNSEPEVAQQTPQGGSLPGGRDMAGLKVRLLGAGWPGAELVLAEGGTGLPLLTSVCTGVAEFHVVVR